MKNVLFATFVAILFCMEALAQAVVVCNRPLPTANLNNGAGANRSNVSWSFGNDWQTGDDCVVGIAGETWVITGLTGWTTSGAPGTSKIGDRFASVNLRLGTPTSPLALVSSGDITVNTNINDNSSITHLPVQYIGGLDYQGTFGSYIQLWQTNFSNLAYVVQGGQKLRFSADGTLLGGIPTYYWFNHASNAAKSGNVQENADGKILAWDKSDLGTLSPYIFDSNGDGWDKSSDLNVVITAIKLVDGMATGGGWFIPESDKIKGLTPDGSKATFGFVAKSKNSVATGNLEFHYNADGINLNSSSYDWAQIATSQAQFEGTGTINGTGSFRFRVRAVDGDKLSAGTPDRFEIRIWTSGGEFDNPLYRAEGNLGGGQVVVHKK
jgi:hypothetical protein